MALHGSALFEAAFFGIWLHCIVDDFGLLGFARSNEFLLPSFEHAIVMSRVKQEILVLYQERYTPSSSDECNRTRLSKTLVIPTVIFSMLRRSDDIS